LDVRRRTGHIAFAIVAGVCAAMTGWYGLQLREAERINNAMATARISDTTVPQARLARALILAQQGKFNVALKTYKSLLEEDDTVRLTALYDLGNLNMREALKNGQGEAQRSLPLIELAKQSYRDDLRSNPDDWDARYNLERALWLSPEYDDPILQRNQAPVRSEHAMSTLQGAKIDLP
jgi:mxaK protein